MVTLGKLFENLVDDDIVKAINDEFEKVADIKLSELGVDSLMVMEIVVRMEDMFNIEIDYDEFELKDIETPRKIREYIENI